MINRVFFHNNFLATDVNLNFVSKIDKDLKSIIDFFSCICVFKKGVIGWNILTSFQSLLIFPICT